MTMQSVLLYMGIALVVAALGLAAMAVYTYRALNIKAVRDDLSGRARAGGVQAIEQGSLRKGSRLGDPAAAPNAVPRASAAAPEPPAAHQAQPAPAGVLIPIREPAVAGAPQDPRARLNFILVKKELLPKRDDALGDEE